MQMTPSQHNQVSTMKYGAKLVGATISVSERCPHTGYVTVFKKYVEGGKTHKFYVTPRGGVKSTL